MAMVQLKIAKMRLEAELQARDFEESVSTQVEAVAKTKAAEPAHASVAVSSPDEDILGP